MNRPATTAPCEGCSVLGGADVPARPHTCTLVTKCPPMDAHTMGDMNDGDVRGHGNAHNATGRGVGTYRIPRKPPAE
jgi:hypothetical protein